MDPSPSYPQSDAKSKIKYVSFREITLGVWEVMWVEAKNPSWN